MREVTGKAVVGRVNRKLRRLGLEHLHIRIALNGYYVCHDIDLAELARALGVLRPDEAIGTYQLY